MIPTLPPRRLHSSQRRYANGFALLAVGLAIVWVLDEFTTAPRWLLGGLCVVVLAGLYLYEVRNARAQSDREPRA